MTQTDPHIIDPLKQNEFPPPPPGHSAPAPDPATVIEGDIEYDDYFSFGEETHTFTLPDGKQQIFFKTMNEGSRMRFQQKTNRDIHFNRNTQDARLKADPASERHVLIMESVTGWSLKRKNPKTGKWEDAPWSTGSPGSELAKWLQVANPKIVDDLESQIRDANPWLLAETTVEQVDQEIERLTGVREDLIKRDQREAAFS